MLNKVLNRLEVLAGLKDNEVEVEEARGLSEENFKALSPIQQIKYIKEYPTSKYGKDPKWLKRAKMLKTRMLNRKKDQQDKFFDATTRKVDYDKFWKSEEGQEKDIDDMDLGHLQRNYPK